MVGPPRRALLLFLAFGLVAPASASAQTVRAADYDAFWLWAGVAPQPLLARARTLYILQGQVAADRAGVVHLIAQGGAISPGSRAEIWLAYRAHTLRWPPDIYAKILARLARWRAAGVPVVGVQIDFDARTRHLDEYADFLRETRRRLGPGDRLSITGLLDWGAGRDPAALDALGGVVDEVVIQTYQGRRTIPGYAAYLGEFARFRFPFKVGLVQDGAWTPPPGLAANPWFRGYVVFLRNLPPPTPSTTPGPVLYGAPGAG